MGVAIQSRGRTKALSAHWLGCFRRYAAAGEADVSHAGSGQGLCRAGRDYVSRRPRAATDAEDSGLCGQFPIRREQAFGSVLTTCGERDLARQRSEEHTSELQSLMRISYAVFCLKKKHNK